MNSNPEIDEAYNNGVSNGFNDGFNDGFNNGFNDGFNNGFNNGFNEGTDNGRVEVFINLVNDGMPSKKAQKYANISDELVKEVLTRL